MATISFPVTVTSVSLDFAHPLTILSWSEALNLDDLWEERAARGLERKDGLHQPAPARPIGNRQRGDHTPIVQGESRGREIEPHVSPAHDGKTRPGDRHCGRSRSWSSPACSILACEFFEPGLRQLLRGMERLAGHVVIGWAPPLDSHEEPVRRAHPQL